jgi:hypothetical protein
MLLQLLGSHFGGAKKSWCLVDLYRALHDADDWKDFVVAMASHVEIPKVMNR